MRHSRAFAAGLLLSALSACDVTINSDNSAADANQASETAQPAQPATPDPIEQFNAQAQERARQLALREGNEEQRAQSRQQAQQELENLRFEVDISDRKLRMFQGDELKGSRDVAVGTKEWPTPTGSWEFHRVDLNPEWNPPKSEDWAKDEERQAPGSAENPMGRARLVYRMPNTVHGTDDLNSLGKASSHGSIRVANEVVLELAEMLLKAGGSWEGPKWFQQMTESRTEEFQIPLEQRIPIEVQE
ncbi:MAG: L,D-transpeptidase family protein [Pseudomonadota bacterium]|nr:L,D-transpeptidase family protein [Pseudomonadota bacterium]